MIFVLILLSLGPILLPSFVAFYLDLPWSVDRIICSSFIVIICTRIFFIIFTFSYSSFQDIFSLFFSLPSWCHWRSIQGLYLHQNFYLFSLHSFCVDLVSMKLNKCILNVKCNDLKETMLSTVIIQKQTLISKFFFRKTYVHWLLIF